MQYLKKDLEISLNNKFEESKIISILNQILLALIFLIIMFRFILMVCHYYFSLILEKIHRKPMLEWSQKPEQRFFKNNYRNFFFFDLIFFLKIDKNSTAKKKIFFLTIGPLLRKLEKKKADSWWHRYLSLC